MCVCVFPQLNERFFTHFKCSLEEPSKTKSEKSEKIIHFSFFVPRSISFRKKVAVVFLLVMSNCWLYKVALGISCEDLFVRFVSESNSIEITSSVTSCQKWLKSGLDFS